MYARIQQTRVAGLAAENRAGGHSLEGCEEVGHHRSICGRGGRWVGLRDTGGLEKESVVRAQRDGYEAHVAVPSQVLLGELELGAAIRNMQGEFRAEGPATVVGTRG